ITALSEDMSLGAPLTLKCQFGKVNGLDYNKDAKHLISGSIDGLINIYSMEQESDQYGHLLGSYNSGQDVYSLLVTQLFGNDEGIVI
ncbi:MAG: WD40 repeat domain-containing protein, partial [bacterium]